jgi:hypothetical protein
MTADRACQASKPPGVLERGLTNPAQAMKLRFIPALLAFLSAYFPLTLILAIKDYQWPGGGFLHPWALGLICGLSFASCLVLLAVIRRYEKGGVLVTLTKATNRSGDMFSYTIPYMLSFLNFRLDDPRMVLSLTVFMLMMFVLSYRTHSMFINPMLALLGYGLYDATFKNGKQERQGWLISRHALNIGSQCKMEIITPSLYVVSEASDPGEAA